MPRHPCVSRDLKVYPVEVTWCDRMKKKFPLRKETLYICRPKKDKINLLMQCRQAFLSDTEIIIDAVLVSDQPTLFHCEMDEQEYFNKSIKVEKEK